MAEIIPINHPGAAEWPKLPVAIHLPSGDVVVPAATFKLTGDALEHARHHLIATGGTYAQVAILDTAIKLLGVPAAPRDPL